MSRIDLVPTEEQSAILQSVRDSEESIMVSALAGCGKTSTLEMVARAKPWPSALALAFNVKIKDELAARFPPNFQVMTFNGLGHRAWAKAISPRPIVEPRKLGKIITALARARNENISQATWDNLRQLTSRAMHCGIVPKGLSTRVQGIRPDEDGEWELIASELWIETSPDQIDFCRVVLRESIKQSMQGLISYDDQVYMSTLFGGVFPRFDLVLVDEAQDLSPLNHIQLKRCSARRLIVVGDARQAIYAFRGADIESMTNIYRLRPNWIDLTLGTTFRCPRLIVNRQQEFAPLFRAAPSTPPGRVLNGVGKPHNDAEEFGEDGEDGSRVWRWQDVPEGQVAVLCRNNAPLISMAFKLIRQRIGCFMIGREIGRGLRALADKILSKDCTQIPECITHITGWKDQQCELARLNGHEEKVASITDKAECLLAVIEAGGAVNAGALKDELTTLFSHTSGRATLSTIHRAKGLEWDTVIHLDPWRIPSRYAKRKGGQTLQQEYNLRYVAETRTKQTLILANLGDFQ